VEQFLVAFFVSFGVIFVAETGDKSQLMAMTFAARYRAIPVLVGITLATAVTHAVSVAIGYGLGASLPVGWIGLAAGLAFLGFAAWTLRGDELTADEQAKADRSTSSAVVAAAVAFFLAELGDKTMLATITLATQHGWAGTWVGSTLGMVLADALAMALGAHLSRRLSERTIRIGSASLFAVFGVVLLAEATGELVGRSLPSILATVIDHHVGGWIALGLMLAVTITALTGVFDVTHRRVRVARSILVAQVALGALLAIVSTVLVGADVVQPVAALYDDRRVARRARSRSRRPRGGAPWSACRCPPRPRRQRPVQPDPPPRRHRGAGGNHGGGHDDPHTTDGDRGGPARRRHPARRAPRSGAGAGVATRRSLRRLPAADGTLRPTAAGSRGSRMRALMNAD
jgi:putative Ca2+/H+ antiporter (TMEM165/GDT1 family)